MITDIFDENYHISGIIEINNNLDNSSLSTERLHFPPPLKQSHAAHKETRVALNTLRHSLWLSGWVFQIQKNLLSIKRAVSLLIDSLLLIVKKIKICFSYLFCYNKKYLTTQARETLETVSIHQRIKRVMIKSLFSFEFNYGVLEYKILSCNFPFPLFNHYDNASYKKLKRPSQTLPHTSPQPEKPLSNIEAGIKTYQAIVSLYVQRFLKRHAEMNHPRYLSALRLVALRIAIKDSIDGFHEFERLNRFLPSNINAKKAIQMEGCFLREIGWNLSLRELTHEEMRNNQF